MLNTLPLRGTLRIRCEGEEEGDGAKRRLAGGEALAQGGELGGGRGRVETGVGGAEREGRLAAAMGGSSRLSCEPHLVDTVPESSPPPSHPRAPRCSLSAQCTILASCCCNMAELQKLLDASLAAGVPSASATGRALRSKRLASSAGR